MKSKIYYSIFFFALLAAACIPAKAQRYFSQPISQYYRNGYLWNPALAGKEGTRLYGLINKSWIGFDGAPTQVSLSGDVKMGANFGVGAQVTSGKSGAFERYMGALSYAYRVQLAEDKNLRIGGNVSFYKERLDKSSLYNNGEADPFGLSFNDNKVSVNGDLGLSYDGGGLTLGATSYNLGAYLQEPGERSADLAIGQVMASYSFKGEDDKISFQPLLAYKMFYHHDNILTAAMQVEYDKVFHAGVYWQSTGNPMGSVGVMLMDLGEVNFFYSGKNKYGYNQVYEVGLKAKLK